MVEAKGMDVTQLTLSLDLLEDKTLNNYYVGGNEQLFTILHQMAHGRGKRYIYFWGGDCVGKTHLLQACCHAANQLQLTNLYIPLKNLKDLRPLIFDDLEALCLVCVDDVEMIAGKPEWEEAFFDFFNRMKEAKKRLIIAGHFAPKGLGLQLLDLESRLASDIVFQVQELTDEEKLQALILRAREKGITLTTEVAQFILNRYPRNLGHLFGALQQLDKASLEAKHRITIPFVKKILNL